MAITYVQGRQAKANINDDVQKLDWRGELADQFKERNPLYMLSRNIGLGVNKTDNVKFQWGEFNQEMVSITVSNSTSGAAGTGTITLTAADKFKEVLKDDIFYNAANSAYLIVTERPTSNVVKVGLVGATSIGATTVDYTGYVMYRITNMKENGLLESEANLNTLSYYAQVTDEYNYCQNIEHWARITKQLAAQPWQFTGMTRREHQQSVMYQNFVDDIENMMFHGKRSVIASGTKYGSRGFVNFGIQTMTGSLSTFNYSNWLTFIRTKVMLENQKKRMTGFCNDYMLQFVQELVDESAFLTLDATGKQDSFGLEIFTLRSPQCTIELRQNRTLDKMYPSQGKLMVMNLNKIGLRHLDGMNITSEFGVQPARSKNYLDNTYASVGTMLLNAGEHSMLTLS